MQKNPDLNIHIYPSYLTNESRILRESKSLIKLSLVKRIEVIGYWKDGLSFKDDISPGVAFVRINTLLSKKEGALKILNLLSFPIFYIKIIIRCFKARPNIVNCHSLTVLPLGVFLKLFFNSKLIYDPHELETETNNSKGLRRSVARVIERLLIHKANAVVVVGGKISEWYKSKYNLNNIHVVKNIPSTKLDNYENSDLRTQVGLSENELIFIYVGVLEAGRGVDLLLDTFKELPKEYNLVFLGYGSLREKIKREKSTSSNIHLLDAVHPDKVVPFISGANVGICLIENSCLSYYYCLPNKTFEYLRAGIPFISSDFPELRMEFGMSNVCWFTEMRKENLKKVILGLSQELVMEKRDLVLKERGNWAWEKEEMKYLEIYSNLK